MPIQVIKYQYTHKHIYNYIYVWSKMEEDTMIFINISLKDKKKETKKVFKESQAALTEKRNKTGKLANILPNNLKVKAGFESIPVADRFLDHLYQTLENENIQSVTLEIQLSDKDGEIDEGKNNYEFGPIELKTTDEQHILDIIETDLMNLSTEDQTVEQKYLYEKIITEVQIQSTEKTESFNQAGVEVFPWADNEQAEDSIEVSSPSQQDGNIDETENVSNDDIYTSETLLDEDGYEVDFDDEFDDEQELLSNSESGVSIDEEIEIAVVEREYKDFVYPVQEDKNSITKIEKMISLGEIVNELGLNNRYSSYVQNQSKKMIENLYSDGNLQSAKTIYEKSQKELIENAAKALGEQFDKVAYIDLEKEAKASKEHEVRLIKDAAEDKLSEERSKLTNTLENHISELKKKEEAEIEKVILEIKESYSKEIEKENMRISSKIEALKQNLIDEANEKERAMIFAEMQQIKQEKNGELEQYRNQLTHRLKNKIEEAYFNTVEVIQETLTDWKQEVNDSLADWLKEEKNLKEEQRKDELHQLEKEKQKKELELKEHNLVLEQEKLNLKRKELEAKKLEEENKARVQDVQAQQAQEKIIVVPGANPNQHLSNDQTQVQKELLELIKEMKKPTPIEQTKTEQKGKMKTAIVAASLMLLLSLSGTFALHQSNQRTLAAERAASKAEVDELKSALEEYVSSEEDLELNELLAAGEYQQAFDLYRDKDSVEEMRNYFITTENVDGLDMLASEFYLTTVELDKSIVEGNAKNIVAAYEKLPKEKQKSLSSTDKDSVKIAYFSIGKDKEAKELG